MSMRLQISNREFITTAFEVPIRKGPVKVCVIHDAHPGIVGGKSQRTAAGHDCEIHAYDFAELALNQRRLETARWAANADILMVAAIMDRSLPSHIEFWMGVSFGLRDNRQGVLVLLTGPAKPMGGADSPVHDYLKIMAAVGGLEFILAQSDAETRMVNRLQPVEPLMEE